MAPTNAAASFCAIRLISVRPIRPAAPQTIIGMGMCAPQSSLARLLSGSPPLPEMATGERTRRRQARAVDAVWNHDSDEPELLHHGAQLRACRFGHRHQRQAHVVAAVA